MQASILIASFNEESHIGETLQSIVNQDFSEGDIEVLVIDGGSTDHTIDIVRQFAGKIRNLHIIPNPRKIAASGWNIGIKHSTAPVVIILSGHVLLPVNYIKTILAELTTELAGIGVRTSPIGKDKKSALIAKVFSSKIGNGGASFMNSEKSGPVESIAFGCYWKARLIDIGGFDESIIRGQDWDLNLRLRAAGQTLWLHEGLATAYYTRTNYTALWRRQFLAGRWKRYIHDKSSKPFLARHWIPSAFVLAVLVTAIASVVWTPSIYLFASILLAHLTASLIQLKLLNLSWRSAIPFWWALLLIHVGYGTGMISGFISPVKPRQENSAS